jgi:hypothetical protein
MTIELECARCCAQFKNSRPPACKSNALIIRHIELIFSGARRSIFRPNSVSLSEEESLRTPHGEKEMGCPGFQAD